MTLVQLLAFSAFAPIARVLSRVLSRQWLMLAASVAAIYWLQPLTTIRYLDFWLPTAALGLTVITWAATHPGAGAQPTPGTRARPATTAPPPAAAVVPEDRRATLTTGLVVGGLVLLIGLSRYLGPVCCLTPSRPPDVSLIVLGLVLISGVTVLVYRGPAGASWLNAGVVVLIGLLLVTKLDVLGRLASAGLRAAGGQDTSLAAAGEISWLGFSYLSFRLIHVLRDRVAGRLPAVSLSEFLTYALFFPAYTAGPIDRLERFVKDERQPFRLDSQTMLDGGTRIALGVLKKFVLADSLALVALNAANAAQANSMLWTWVLVYAYAWRLYWDFSGYSDIAIGLGRFFGVRLPENFDRPYTRQNLTLFWNSWHITLAQWFRAYVFNPLTRALRARPLPVPAIILITQMVTMVLIGLWHGVTVNFIIWGAWHGLGLFVHNRWADYTRPRAAELDARPRLKRLVHLAGVVATFHYVALGWVWFVLPTPGLALGVFERLLGLGGLALSAPAGAAAQPQAAPAAPSPRVFLFRVVVKALLLFALADLAFALVDPLPVLGRLSAYNVVLPGRLRLPYGDNPDQDYSLSLFQLDAMFASHEVARPKAADEFRVLVVGDSSIWGWLLPPKQTLATQLDAMNSVTATGRRMRFYNLGYPILSLSKDLLLMSALQRYQPDLIVWLVTLESFPADKQLFPPIVQNNADVMRALIARYHLNLNPNDPGFVSPNFWDRTLIGRRRDLADLLRLQLYGVEWAATGIDRNIPASYTPLTVDFANDPSFHKLAPPHLTADELAFDVLKAGLAEAGPAPVLLVNEPTFVSHGQNSDIRYNFYYPRWAYDDYRQLLAAEAQSEGWHYLDLWDAAGDDQFTDSPIHLSATGEGRLAASLSGPILALANSHS